VDCGSWSTAHNSETISSFRSSSSSMRLRVASERVVRSSKIAAGDHLANPSVYPDEVLHQCGRLPSVNPDEVLRDNARACRSSRALYYPYVEPAVGAGRGLVAALARRAALVVTDWFPASFLPRMIAAAAARSDVRVDAVDSTGLIPVATHGRAFPSARGYRGFMQRNLREHLGAFPDENPLARLERSRASLPAGVERRWPRADLSSPTAARVAALPIDHSVPPSALPGGQRRARQRLEAFLDTQLAHYAEAANHPDAEGTSHLSPYLHFGHIAAHEVFSALMTRERWTSRRLARGAPGTREGWWGVSAGAEHFLDQVVVWRELAFNGCAWTPGFDSFATLPRWARETLDAHRVDPRPHVYSLEQLDAAATHDEVWNAAQTELRTTGWCHGYMRMVWGKKILEWSRQPEEALEHMAALMDRYSLDGRDPVSYLNYGWVLGRYDRPWFERPIFGTVRYMTSESAKRKLKMKKYLATFSAPGREARR
jgi:deoxyribodipyrimidine photo-lyase